MIKEIIENFKPQDYDTVLFDFQLDDNLCHNHLKELLSMLEEGGYDEDAEALRDFIDQDEINERLMQMLCEETDNHPVHFDGDEEWED